MEDIAVKGKRKAKGESRENSELGPKQKIAIY